MRYSQLFGKTVKNVSEDLESKNAQLLIKAGFVDQLTAGVYTYLPLGLRVLNRIKNIVREEMEAIGGQEILMPALTPKEPWAKTGRWEDPGKEVMFQLEGHGDKEYALGWTHEEIVTPLVKKFVKSYKDLPVMVYQIQNKFRNEPRAKAGLLRGREFSMKDLYSFHRDEAELAALPLGRDLLAVTGAAGLLLHDRLTATDDAVEEGGLADVGTAHDGNDREVDHLGGVGRRVGVGGGHRSSRAALRAMPSVATTSTGRGSSSGVEPSRNRPCDRQTSGSR